jgi:hypothetical protein
MIVGDVAVSAGVMREAQGWVADCLGRTGLAPVDVTLTYVAREFPGGWRAFVAMDEAAVLVAVSLD